MIEIERTDVNTRRLVSGALRLRAIPPPMELSPQFPRKLVVF